MSQTPVSGLQLGVAVPLLAILVPVAAASMLIFSSGEPLRLVVTVMLGASMLTLFIIRPTVFLVVVGIAYAASQGLFEKLELAAVAGIRLNGAQIFGLGVTALLLLRMLSMLATGSRLQRFPRFTPLLIAFFLSTAAATVYSPVPNAALASLFRTLAVLTILVFAYLTTKNLRTLHLYLSCAAGAAVVIAASGVIQSLFLRGPQEILRGGAFRAEGTMGVAQAGVVCLLGLPAFAYYLELPKRRYLWIAVPLLMLICLGLFTSFVRAALLAAGLFVVWQLAPSGSGRQSSRVRQLAIALLLIGGLMIGLMTVDDTTLQARMKDVPVFGSLDSYDPQMGSGRGMIWRAIFIALGQNSALTWLFGNGVHATTVATGKIVFTAFTAHNSFLAVLYNQGLVGLAIYVSFLIAILRELRRASARDDELGRAASIFFRFTVVYYMTVAMFGSTVYTLPERWYLFLVLGSIIGAVHAAEDRDANQPGDAAAEAGPAEERVQSLPG